MVSPEFVNFFIASAGAAAALVGLLFVAVSLAPEQTVTRHAPMERQAVTGSAFTALTNAFFISLFFLIPHYNAATAILPFSGICLLTSLLQAWHLLRVPRGWRSLLRRAFLVLLSVGIYSLELVNGFQLLTAPSSSQAAIVFDLLWCLIGAFSIGLVRAWELLGAERYGPLGWLNPLRDLADSESSSRVGDSHAAVEHPATEEAAPHSPSQ